MVLSEFILSLRTEKLYNMHRIFYLLLFISTCVGSLEAQSMVINEEPAVAELMNNFISINKSMVNVDGWRIQLLATTDRNKMENAKQNFQYQYPNIAVNWVHEKPYYKLRAGAFASKLEATRMLYILKREYPGAYPAKDRQIRPGELAGYF